jgi:hypothetical protein
MSLRVCLPIIVTTDLQIDVLNYTSPLLSCVATILSHLPPFQPYYQ